MPKTDDTYAVPETLSAPWLKRFFRNKFGIPVRVGNANSNSWVQIWIQSDGSPSRALHYSHAFPPELGNRCMRIVYAGSEKLREQNWGGNIQPHSISLHGRELRQLLQGLLDRPIGPLTESSYRDAMVSIERLMDDNPAEGTLEADRLQTLAALVQKYEAD